MRILLSRDVVALVAFHLPSKSHSWRNATNATTSLLDTPKQIDILPKSTLVSTFDGAEHSAAARQARANQGAQSRGHPRGGAKGLRHPRLPGDQRARCGARHGSLGRDVLRVLS